MSTLEKTTQKGGKGIGALYDASPLLAILLALAFFAWGSFEGFLRSLGQAHRRARRNKGR